MSVHPRRSVFTKLHDRARRGAGEWPPRLDSERRARSRHPRERYARESTQVDARGTPAPRTAPRTVPRWRGEREPRRDHRGESPSQPGRCLRTRGLLKVSCSGVSCARIRRLRMFFATPRSGSARTRTTSLEVASLGSATRELGHRRVDPLALLPRAQLPRERVGVGPPAPCP